MKFFPNSTRLNTKVYEMTLTADATATAFPDGSQLIGYWLSQVKVKAVGDDAFTFSIQDGDGTTIGTITTTSATGGEFMMLASAGAENRFIHNVPKYVLSDFSGTSVKVSIVVSH